MELARNLRKDPVAQLDPAPPRVVPRTATVADAVDLMRQANVGCVLVCDADRLVGLTGSPAAIQDVTKEYRVYVRKSDAETAEGAYLVDHSTFTFLMDREGRYLSHFGASTTAEEMSKRIAQAVEAS